MLYKIGGKRKPMDLRTLLLFVVVVFVWMPPIITGISTAAAENHLSVSPRILHIMSYHKDWIWNVDQLEGFKQGLNAPMADIKIFEMDTKRNSSEVWKRQMVREARHLIETWQPDLVYSNDDNAQAYVGSHYVNHSIPFVFSGVNADPAVYGFVGSQNITGVLEQEHILASVNLLRKIVPSIQKIGVVIDDGPTWPGVVQRMQSKLRAIPDVEITTIKTFRAYADYQRWILQNQEAVDALAVLGIFTFKDGSGRNVPFQEVLEWTAKNSRLPDFSLWESRIPYGTLCAVTVSGYAQGFAAGQIANGILFQGRSPASYPMAPTVKGEPVISLARAKKLGIRVNTDILLSARVIKNFEWDQ